MLEPKRVIIDLVIKLNTKSKAIAIQMLMSVGPVLSVFPSSGM
ncbi:hypothetical protein GRAN_4438 [Granulicella sibirica]|uniref:Uncharacterized protein n=1 Tax=Granulicella sibirica TaxID=2479048 RepID=A0A4V1L5D0_9BACT|nr:hypothetical protein GRAN_4438 [Granulicella sibirica]